MSASEKLKALDANLPFNYPQPMNGLRHALPEIVAVVEAAQTVNDDLYFDPILAAALAALDEALSGTQVGERWPGE